MIPHSLKNPLEAITKSFYFNLDRFETKKLIILIKWQNFFAARILARSGVNDRDHYGDHYRDHYGGRVKLSGCPDSRTNEKAAGNTQSGSQHYK